MSGQDTNSGLSEESSSSSGDASYDSGGIARILSRVMARLRGRNGESQQLRDTLEEIIGEIDEDDEEASSPISNHERMLLTNVFRLRHLTAYDVMVPRADIVATSLETGYDELVKLHGEAGHSRLPVYRESLDDVVGMVHIKDVITGTHQKSRFRLANILRQIDFVAPSMRVLDLLLEMRVKRSHMALVVDEFGGIDGLITIEDLVEEIVGEIDDEHDEEESPKMTWRQDGTLIANARTPIEDFEEEVGEILSEEEREEDIDTLGGLVFYLAGRVPARGELIHHPASGITFEVQQADLRRIRRLRIRDLPHPSQAAANAS